MTKPKTEAPRPPSEILGQEIEAFFNERLSKVIGFAKVAETKVRAVDNRAVQQEKRFKDVLEAIANYSGDDPEGHARLLCMAALGKDGTKPGSIGWSFTSRILQDPTVTGYCTWCGINCYGKKTSPGAMPCNVPGCPYETAAEQNREMTQAEITRLEKVPAA